MTTRADVTRLSAAQRRLVALAQGELTAFFGTLDLSRPGAVRDALVEIVPLLVREYGDLASAAAAEWYEQIRPQAGFNARTVPAAPAEAVIGSTRALAGSLWGDSPRDALSAIQGAMQRHISYSGRATVARNVSLDPLNPRYGRVPSGGKTCAWCTMLASRGFVYDTKESAGIIADHYHDDCDCQVVAEFDREQHHIEGYDPDGMYGQYMQARDAANSGDPKVIASKMRELFPDAFTDSHTH